MKPLILYVIAFDAPFWLSQAFVVVVGLTTWCFFPALLQAVPCLETAASSAI